MRFFYYLCGRKLTLGVSDIGGGGEQTYFKGVY